MIIILYIKKIIKFIDLQKTQKLKNHIIIDYTKVLSLFIKI